MIKRFFSNIILIILSFSVFFFLLNSCKEENKKSQLSIQNTDYSSQPDQTGWDVQVYFIDSSLTKAILDAKRSRVFATRMETLLDFGIKVKFLSRFTGNVLSTLTADSARVDDRTKDMLASGNVVVIGDSTKTRLETTVLHWNNSTQKLYTTEFVKISSPNETIQGYGMESDQNLSNYRIFKVSGVQK